jgi:hypothetical protein
MGGMAWRDGRMAMNAVSSRIEGLFGGGIVHLFGHLNLLR